MRTCQSGGAYLRIADPDWLDPLDGSASMVRGGRWNAAGSYPAIYLNADIETARANAELLIERTTEGMPFTVDDLDPEGLPVLVTVDLPSCDVLDAVSPRGLADAGLPVTYPRRPAGDPLPWEACQRVGMRAHDDGLSRIAYRSSARAAGGGEVAWLPRNGGPLQAVADPQPFAEWFRAPE